MIYKRCFTSKGNNNRNRSFRSTSDDRICFYLDGAHRWTDLYSHNLLLPTRTADRTEEWADSPEPLT